MSVHLRQAESADTGLVLDLIRELAAYERLLNEVEAGEAELRAALFGPHPRVFCSIAEWADTPGQPQACGFALWFYTFSTFTGRHGIYLEDLFVRATHRGKGIGKALLADLARRCIAEGLPRLEWSVLDWNTAAIDFYRARGALMMDEWTHCRVERDAIARLARS